MKVLMSLFLLMSLSSQVHAARCWCHAFLANQQLGDLPGNGIEFAGDNETNCLNIQCLQQAGHASAMDQFKATIDTSMSCKGKPNGSNLELRTRARVGAYGGKFKTYATLNCQTTIACPEGSWADNNFPGKCVSGVADTGGIKGSGLRDQRLQNNEFFIWQGGLFKVSNNAVSTTTGIWK